MPDAAVAEPTAPLGMIRPEVPVPAPALLLTADATGVTVASERTGATSRAEAPAINIAPPGAYTIQLEGAVYDQVRNAWRRWQEANPPTPRFSTTWVDTAHTNPTSPLNVWQQWTTGTTVISNNNFVTTVAAGTTATQFVMNVDYGQFAVTNEWLANGVRFTAPKRVTEYRLRRRRRAAARAEDLLRELVGDGLYQVWKEQGHVIVSSRRVPTVGYKITGRGEMIRLLQRDDKGGWRERGERLCIHPASVDGERAPLGDEVATLVILARHDEATLWGEANYHDGRGGVKASLDEFADLLARAA